MTELPKNAAANGKETNLDNSMEMENLLLSRKQPLILVKEGNFGQREVKFRT